MNIRPLGHRVLIKPIETEEKTKSGLYIPDSAKEKPLEAEVIAVGDAKDITVKKGDKVIYEAFSSSEVKINGIKHIIVDAKDILAIIE